MTQLAAIALTGPLGYFILAGLIGAESFGIPVPGETALITAGILASRGQMSIVAVIALAAAAAIIGDNFGYLVARRGGRALLERPGRFDKQRRRILDEGEPFFARHGAKAVFLGRWFAGLRVAAAWLAGISHMPWRTFIFWNALGGIAWATSVGLLAYLLGPTAEKIFKTIGFVGVGAVIIVGLGIYLWRRSRRTPTTNDT